MQKKKVIRDNEWWVRVTIPYMSKKGYPKTNKVNYMILWNNIYSAVECNNSHFFFEGRNGFEMRFETTKKYFPALVKRIKEEMKGWKKIKKYKVDRYKGEAKDFFPIWPSVKKYFTTCSMISCNLKYLNTEKKSMGKDANIRKLIHTFMNQRGYDAFQETENYLDFATVRNQYAYYGAVQKQHTY